MAIRPGMWSSTLQPSHTSSLPAVRPYLGTFDTGTAPSHSIQPLSFISWLISCYPREGEAANERWRKLYLITPPDRNVDTSGASPSTFTIPSSRHRPHANATTHPPQPDLMTKGLGLLLPWACRGHGVEQA